MSLNEQINLILSNQMVLFNQNRELIYAEKFHDTIKGSEWLPTDFPLSPGDAALGYPALYVLYRILNEFHPVNILEMGLGQSTKMIGKYVEKHDMCKHQVVEHDKTWIDFFSGHFKLAETSKIVECPINNVSLDLGNGPFEVTVYMEFADKFEGSKYDFICIDGPYGYTSHTYSRIDIISILPESLSDSFVIMLDDCDRSGESNTLNLISQLLEEQNISHAKGIYRGAKGTGLVVSKNLSFLLTM